MTDTLNLSDVTLCCVDTQLPEHAARAMHTCLHQAQFGDAILFTDLKRAPAQLDGRIRCVDASHIRSIEAYSQFLLTGLADHISTSHVLIVQWDGYIIHPEQWRPGFLAFDYIGAPWPQFEPAHRVGNGGFSLRSRKLLEALAKLAPTASKAEDMLICHDLRPTLERDFGIRFADETTAHAFATERSGDITKSFGFHGLSNFAHVLGERELTEYIASLPDNLLASTEARALIKALLKQNRVQASHQALLKRGRALKRVSLAEWRLRGRLRLKQFVLKLK